MTDAAAPPTLYDYMGGRDALIRLIDLFYARVAVDPLLGPVFAHMDAAHARHVADFIGEVFGGPATYTAQHGGHIAMVRGHLGKLLDEPKRRRWMDIMLDCADAVGLPADPEFRSAFVGYLEWGTRMAVNNSQPGVVACEQPMPTWGWGEVKGPYKPT